MAEVKRTDPIQGDIIHEYDGIEEADNDLPLWLTATFYACIVFAVLYWFTYQEYGLAPSPRQAYATAMAAQAAEGAKVTDPMIDALAKDSRAVAAGKEIFDANCVACHDTRAQGKIGPNLTDRYWIHGGAPTDIYHTIEHGVAAKGMPTWGPVLGNAAVEKVAAFIVSIRDTNVPGKAPEGAPWAAATDAGAGSPKDAGGGMAPTPSEGGGGVAPTAAGPATPAPSGATPPSRAPNGGG